MAKQMYAFRINDDLLEAVEEHSQESHTTVSNVIRIALFTYMTQMRKQQSSERYTSNTAKY